MNNPLSRRISVPVNRLVGRVTGHIRKPYTLRQIVQQVESNEYNDEMMLQHLLRWVTANAPEHRQGARQGGSNE